jgi:hypothetical protein
MSCGIHKKHAEEHHVTSNTTSFGVVDLESGNFSNLSSLNIKEAGKVSQVPKTVLWPNLLDIMGADVNDSID